MACSYIIHGLTNDCKPSLGGIKEIWIHAYGSDVFNVDGRITDNISGGTTGHTYTVTGITASGWTKFDLRKNTASMTSTAQIDDANGVNFVETELNLIFTKMETAKRIEIASLMLNDSAVIVKDCNGVRYALGIDNPVRATASTGESGTAKTDGNKYTITLKDDALEYPMMLADSVADPS